MAKKNSNAVDVAISIAAGARYKTHLKRKSLEFLEKLELREVELSVSLVSDKAIHRLNRTWRKKDKPTDVLSFPAGESLVGPRLLGDIIISLDTTRRAAKEERRTIHDELARYLAHGLLHLLGHDHHRPKETKRMAEAEALLLGQEGMIPVKVRRRRV